MNRVVRVDPNRSAGVRFIARPDGSLEGIEIDSPRGRPALADVHWVLYSMHIEIVHTVARVSGERVLETIYVAERDGGNVERKRQLEIQRQLIPLIWESLLAHSARFEAERDIPAESGQFEVARPASSEEPEDVREIA